MASDVVYEAVRAFLTAGWTAAPIAWENEHFDKPNPPAPWLAVELSGTVYAQQSIGAGPQEENRWDEDGVLWLHVFVPAGTGSSTARGYAKALADIFRGALLIDETLEFMDASIGMGEAGDNNGNWWRVSVSIDWRRMEA